MKKLAILLITLSISISLVACSSGTKAPAPAQNELEKADVSKTEEQQSKNIPEKPEATPAPIPVPAAVNEESKEIEVLVEGNKEMRKADLTKSSQLNYEFYLLENYGFDAEEPGKDIIYSKYDDSFFVRIEKLDKNTDLDSFKKSQIQSYKNLGKVTEINPSTLFHKRFNDSDFSFITEARDANGMKTSILYIAKTYDKEKFVFTFFMPLKEAAEGITPSFWAMLGTLELK